MELHDSFRLGFSKEYPGPSHAVETIQKTVLYCTFILFLTASQHDVQQQMLKNFTVATVYGGHMPLRLHMEQVSCMLLRIVGDNNLSQNIQFSAAQASIFEF